MACICSPRQSAWYVESGCRLTKKWMVILRLLILQIVTLRPPSFVRWCWMAHGAGFELR